MDVEDSYEGAVRRLQRLENAGIVLDHSAAFDRSGEDREALHARIRDLEELASLACEDNERLERELGEARDQVVSLQRLVKMLEEDAPAPAPAPRAKVNAATLWPPVAAVSAPVVAAPEIVAPITHEAVAHEPVAHHAFAPTANDIDIDVDLAFLKKKRGFPIGLALGIAGVTAGALLLLHPWEHPQNIVAMAAVAPPAPAPVVAAPVVTAPAPVVTAPIVTAPAVSIPTVKTAPVVPTVKHAPVAKRHAAPKHVAQHAEKKHHKKEHVATTLREATKTSDPLGGLDL